MGYVLEVSGSKTSHSLRLWRAGRATRATAPTRLHSSYQRSEAGYAVGDGAGEAAENDNTAPQPDEERVTGRHFRGVTRGLSLIHI